MTRSKTQTPRKSQNPTTSTKANKSHVSNLNFLEAEDASINVPSNSDSGPEPDPPHPESEDSSTGNKSDSEADDIPNEEVNVVKKKTSAKKRKTVEAEDDEELAKCVFPMNRVKMIAKSEGGDDMRLSHEAIFLLNKASEKFLELFSAEAYAESASENKNFVAYNHLSASVSKEQRLCFLSDLIPVKITAEEALRERQLPNTDPNAPPIN